MFLLLEILIVAVLISYVCFAGHARTWLGSLKPGDSNLIFVILFLVVAAHFCDRGGKFFPLISWRMYTQVYEPETVQWAEIHAEFTDGETQTINPAKLYPSIARNYQTRLKRFVVACENGELSDRQMETFEQLLVVFANRLSEKHQKPIDSISAVLCVVETKNPNKVTQRVVKEHLLARKPDLIAYKTKSFAPPQFVVEVQ